MRKAENSSDFTFAGKVGEPNREVDAELDAVVVVVIDDVAFAFVLILIELRKVQH